MVIKKIMADLASAKIAIAAILSNNATTRSVRVRAQLLSCRDSALPAKKFHCSICGHSRYETGRSKMSIMQGVWGQAASKTDSGRGRTGRGGTEC